MKANLTKRALSLMLAFAMVLSLAAPAAATGAEQYRELSFRKSSAASSLEAMGQTGKTAPDAPAHEDSDMVRASIVLEEASTLHSGFSTLEKPATPRPWPTAPS